MRTLIEKQNPDEILPDHTLNDDHLNILQKLINNEDQYRLLQLQNKIIWISAKLREINFKLADEHQRMLYITETYLNDLDKIMELINDNAKESGVCGQQTIEFEYKCFLVTALVNYYPENEPHKDWDFSAMHGKVNEIFKYKLEIMNS